MRVKDPSKDLPEKGKRSKRPLLPHDEDSSDDIAVGLTCQHISYAVSVNHVKKAVAETLWSVCSECLKERRLCDGQPVLPSDVWLCLKCGFQGCGKNSESQHSLRHFKSSGAESHCVVISLSTWVIWCYECNEKLSTHCNKKVLAQIVDFLQKHVFKTQTDAFSRIIKLCEEKREAGEIKKGKKGCAVPSVKGITNLGNTCFFNAVIQNLAQTYILFELMNEIKEDGTKFKISLSSAPQLEPLVVELSSPGPLTSALFLFLHSMKEAEKGPLSPKVLFNQLCQKAPRFKGFQQQDSQELLHHLLDAVRTEETKRIQASILKAFNNPTTKTADEETRKKVKAYGKEGVKMNFIDRIFIGELTSTVMCEECANISTMKDPFIDISLPIIEERVSKPVLLGKMSKCRSLQETDQDHNKGTVTVENTHPPRAAKKHSSPKDKAKRKAGGVYTNARKQLLISAVPAILILHLKRFHQAGLSLRKVNRHVDFPLTLDLAPFCAATCKNISVGEKVLYGLYGIVEHSGSMRGGHYTAYVKVRVPSRKLSECITGRKTAPGLKEADSELGGHWVHVSDTYVQVVPESRALSAQAYLLFYERIL
ncbi:ubiquitin specific petidase 45 (predicted), isoform CRA_b [Rattus norvegicus]|uniref:Ubiquitin carboxyl-terminal hydrolase n=2 Tax=Rattus norvegicus TaxID=10116 RepID=A6IIE7_RAT|nr:ubiquitin specific petidase 45 (predicted), isoform CRA_b [Rattus norvegicus]|eukprot:NP_001101388.1 ubiquitin carboxyl-terminal hydrolase 45 [Rattus norvegicus]